MMISRALAKHLSLILLLVWQVLAGFAAAAETPGKLDKVRLQLKWFHQFQFAGYYAAIEKGYYVEEGLDVEIVERQVNKNIIQQVIGADAEFGVGDSGLITQYAKGVPVTALAAIFQHNPLVFISRQDSGIISPYEMGGKRIMIDFLSSNEAPLRALLANANITEKDFTYVPISYDSDALTRKEVDVMEAYLTDQTYFFRQKGLPINIINPQNYGIDFYGDILFTSNRQIEEHPKRVAGFLRASLKGWRYALAHQEELIQIIHEKYHSKLPIDHLRFEAVETKRLIVPDVVPLGHMEASRMKMVADTYTRLGLNRELSDEELAKFIYQSQREALDLTDDEKAWLVEHPVVKVGVDRDFAPYEYIDQHGAYLGLAADYLKLIEKKLGVRFEIVHDKPWAEILGMAKRGELDMLACAVNTPERSQYLSFTEPYKKAHAVIIDNGQGGFIGNLDNLAGKRVVVERGYFMEELLRKQHPRIQLITASDTRSALIAVLDGKADAYVGDAGSANYVIKKEGLLSLRFSGQTEYVSQHSMAVSRIHPQLASIIGKAMADIPKAEADAIFDRWLGKNVVQGIPTDTLIKYGLVILLLFLLVGYWVYRLRREVAVRKRAEQTVQLLLTEQKAMLETELVGIVKVRNRKVVWANPAFEKMLGYQRGELIGLSSRVNYPSEQAYLETGAEAYPILRAGGIYRTQIQHVRKDGGLIWVDLSGCRLSTDVDESLWTFVDITENKRAEEKLRASSLYARSLIEASLDPMLTISVEGLIMDVNQATEKVTGCSRQALIGSDFSIYFNQPDQARKCYQQVFSEGFVTDFALTAHHRSGLLTELLFNASVYRDIEGNIQGALAAARDVTERKRIEDALREARDSAEKAAYAKSQFLANMSHEIRTPMNAVVGLSQLALNQPLTEEVRDYLQKINVSSVSLLGILNDILDFSKMEAGKLSIEKKPFDLSLLLENLANMFAVQARSKQLDFRVDIAPQTPLHLVGDALRIQQILSNLLSNAIKFTQNGRIEILVAPVASTAEQVCLRFCIRDSGIGISQHDLGKLFQPFSQVDDSITRRFGGTGLGLAISHKLLALMGGDFEVKSQPGEGSCFQFELTLALAEDGIAPQSSEYKATQRDAGGLSMTMRELGQALSGSSILVAEDNPINQQVVREFLQLIGIKVDIAENGIIALRLLQEHAYDAVLMDVHMPEMGGVEATQYIRKQPRFNDLPVIALTAGVTQEERDRCMACGMNDFVAKPVDPQLLVAVLCRWIKNLEPQSIPEKHVVDAGGPLADLPGFDLGNILLMSGGDQRFVRQLLGEFKSEYGGFLQHLQSLLDAEDFVEAQRLVHTLKGVAGNLGAKALNLAGEALDRALKQRSVPEKTYADFRQAMQDALASLEALG